jgi:hypothetical protein
MAIPIKSTYKMQYGFPTIARVWSAHIVVRVNVCLRLSLHAVQNHHGVGVL